MIDEALLFKNFIESRTTDFTIFTELISPTPDYTPAAGPGVAFKRLAFGNVDEEGAVLTRRIQVKIYGTDGYDCNVNYRKFRDAIHDTGEGVAPGVFFCAEDGAPTTQQELSGQWHFVLTFFNVMFFNTEVSVLQAGFLRYRLGGPIFIVASAPPAPPAPSAGFWRYRLGVPMLVGG